VTALRVVLALLIVAASWPELSRYAAERRLYEVSAVLQAVFRRPPEAAEAGRIVTWATAAALDASAALPGDWRSLNLAGSASLLAHRPDAALDRYRQALGLGERPEIVVNVGRAHLALGRADEARAAFVRALWVSPGLHPAVPRALQPAVDAEVGALERTLAAGRLRAPPPPP